MSSSLKIKKISYCNTILADKFRVVLNDEECDYIHAVYAMVRLLPNTDAFV